MKTDMRAKSVTWRLKKTSQLRRLCISLGGERFKKRFHQKYKDLFEKKQ